jgi:UDP-N-acetylglucosamine:LPS N-acetylglucosamine transferase
MEKPLKICAAASAGGHLVQLLRLAESWGGCETFFVSTSEIVRSKLASMGTVYILEECNRKHPIRLFRVLLETFWIVKRERPDVVISTGAAPALLICLWGKIWGAKIIWVDSMANVRRLSLSGRLVRPWADLFLTQWEFLKNERKRIEFAGSVL